MKTTTTTSAQESPTAGTFTYSDLIIAIQKLKDASPPKAELDVTLEEYNHLRSLPGIRQTLEITSSEEPVFGVRINIK